MSIALNRREAVIPTTAREARQIVGQKTEIRTVTMREIRAVVDGDDGPILSGQAIVWDSPSLDMWGWYEVIKRGALEDILSGSPDVRFLVNHSGIPYARTTSGSLDLEEGPTGLDFVARLAPVQAARDLAISVARGDINQMSFAFRADPNGVTWSVDDDGRDRREIHKFMEFDEISVVTFPAYPASHVDNDERSAPDLSGQRAAQDPPADPASADTEDPTTAYRGVDPRIAAFGR